MRRVPDPPHVIVQRLTDAFNKQDLDAVSLCVAANCVVANHGGETVQVGAPAICAQYAAAFDERPKVRISVMGRMQPSFSGISSSISVRNTYSTAARQIERGALKLVGRCGAVPVKSTVACWRAASIETLTFTRPPSSMGHSRAPDFNLPMARRTALSA